ncbi:UDP binding domain-containing protein [Parabacteroides sp.]
MNIAIVGTGYVGLVSGTCFAEMGVDVTCVDVNREKINGLLEGNIPIYEPETDDMREATSLVMIDLLRKAGAVVKVFDPVAIGECKRRVADRVVYAKDMYEAVIDADALLLLTEWKQFRLPSWAVIKKVMRQPLLLDGRNIYDAKELGELGFTYECIGK